MSRANQRCMRASRPGDGSPPHGPPPRRAGAVSGDQSRGQRGFRSRQRGSDERQRGSRSQQRGSYGRQRGSRERRGPAGQRGPGLQRGEFTQRESGQHGSCHRHGPHSPPVSIPQPAAARRRDRSRPPVSRWVRRGPEEDLDRSSASHGTRRRSRPPASPIFVRRIATPPSSQESGAATAADPPAVALGRPPSDMPLSDVDMFSSADDLPTEVADLMATASSTKYNIADKNRK